VPLTIVNVGYRSTNYWVVSNGASGLLVDLGWPGTLPTMKARMRQMGVTLAHVRLGLATHYHIDHAGLAQDLKELGVRLMVLESQVSAIPLMKRHIKPQDHYTEITQADNLVTTFAASRGRLREVGIAGEVVPTPGHSDDSVSLVLDEGAAFTGDLTPLSLADAENFDALTASWQRLRESGVRTVYPGHGPPRPLRV
jgi:endoribonuclease LACTB2